MNDEIVLHPRLNGYFKLCAGTSGISFLQNISDGSQPIAIFNPLGKSVEFSEILIYLIFTIKLK